MNVGTLTISLAARTAALTAASSRVKAFETGIVASAQRANRSLLMLGQTFSALTIPIAAISIASTKMFSDFEFELAKVQGLVGIAADKVSQWGQQILQMGPEVAKSPRELAEALYFVTSAGIRGAETMEVLQMSALAASAGLGETKSVADAVTSAMNAYGSENLSAAEATDILIMAVREGKVVAEDLASSIGKVFPVAAQLGVSFNEVGAAIAAMTRTGTPASTSAIYLRRVLSSIINPTADAKNALNAMGDSFFNFREMLDQPGGLLDVLLKVRSMVDEFGETQIAKIFPNLRALIPVLDIIGNNLEKNKVIWENMLNPIGALDNAVSAVSNTFKYQWDSAISDLDTSLIRLGEAMKRTILPVVQDLITWIKRAVDWWVSLDNQTQGLITRITLLVGVLGPLTVIFGAIANAVLNLIGLMTGLMGQFLLFAVVTGFLASVAKQFSEMQSAIAGAEDGVTRTQTSLEKFSSNLGVYLNIALTKLQIFSIKIGVIFGDVISGIVNTLNEGVNQLIRISNKLTPGTKLDLPEFTKIDIGGYYREQLDIAEKSLQDFMDLRPGGAEAWNWADQLFGSKSGFKEAGKELWTGFKDDALSAVSVIKDQIAKLFPNVTGMNRSSNIVWEQLIPKPAEVKTKAQMAAETIANTINRVISASTDSFTDLTGPFKILTNQFRIIDQQFSEFGSMVDLVGLKTQALNDLMDEMKERGGPFDPDDIDRVRQMYDELQGISELKSTLDSFGGIFSQSTLDNILKATESLHLTKLQMTDLISIGSFLGNVFSELGASLGRVAAGAEDGFSGLLDVIVNTFKQIGSLLSKAGAILSLIPGFQALGLGLLFGGMALSAIGGYIQERSRQDSNVAKMANGGIIPDGFSNDTFPAMLSSREAVIPLDRLPQMMNLNPLGERKVIFQLDGKVIWGALVAQEKAYNVF